MIPFPKTSEDMLALQQAQLRIVHILKERFTSLSAEEALKLAARITNDLLDSPPSGDQPA